MAAINPYIIFDGNCEEAFNFYRSVFGGEFGYVGRYSEMPPSGEKPVSKDYADKLMHISLPIGGNTTLMGSDKGEHGTSDFKEGNNISIAINADSRQQADKIFNAISAGGTVEIPMADMFWGDYYGMCVDKFGINWMMTFNEKQAGKN